MAYIGRVVVGFIRPHTPINNSKAGVVTSLPINNRPSHAIEKNSILFFKRVFASAFKYTKMLINIGIVGYATYKTPGAWKAINGTTRFVGIQPKAVSINTRNQEINGIKVDNFVSNYPGFKKIKDEILKEKIDPKSLDTNNSGIILDSTQEITELENSLKEKKLIDLTHEIKTTSQLIWGKDGPNPYNTIQAYRPNCQIMADIQGHFLTEENIQKIKQTVRVLNLNPTNENFRIDTFVELNGKRINIPFKELVKWMSPKDITPSYSRDGSLSVPILTYAIEKGLEKYGGVPNSFPSASATLLTGNDFYTMSTTSLSDQELINILVKAPHTLTKLGTRSITVRELTLNDFTDFWLEFFKIKPNKYILEQTNLSPEKAENFKNSLKDITQNITSNFTKHTSIIPKQNKVTLNTKSLENELLANHMYTVKEFKRINNEYITTIIDSHGFEFDLTLGQIKKHMSIIVSQSNNFPNLNTGSTKAIFYSLILLALMKKGTSKIERKYFTFST